MILFSHSKCKYSTKINKTIITSLLFKLSDLNLNSFQNSLALACNNNLFDNLLFVIQLQPNKINSLNKYIVLIKPRQTLFFVVSNYMVLYIK